MKQPIEFLCSLCTLLASLVLSGTAAAQEQKDSLTPDVVIPAARIIGLDFSGAERDSMMEELNGYLQGYSEMRAFPLVNSAAPAVRFDPVPSAARIAGKQEDIVWGLPEDVNLPENRNELAFYTVAQLSSLIRGRKIRSAELTRFFLDRLKQYGDTLECVITLTETLAMKQAERADKEIAEGRYRGPLHGIPYGVKDLLAVKGYRTTWGAVPYRDQVIDEDAAVVRKLEAAGAVLVAKLSMGALAWGDVWYGGTTRNPWNLQEGSSGSSAGSASATAAGLVPFAIGTETYGSIVSPSNRCGVTGLRPTFGRVSRAGAMALSWTMDKIGPICRSAEDCALVFNAIRGADAGDADAVDRPFNYRADRDIRSLRIGYIRSAFERNYYNRKNDSLALDVFRKMGVTLQSVVLPDSLPLGPLTLILTAEAAAAFDDLTRSGRDSLLVRQIKNAWPNVFRAARFVPAVEYIQANRIRRLWIEKMYEVMKDYDVIVTPTYGANQLLITNLTGHPSVALPNGFLENGSPTSFCLIGNLYDEASLLEAARAWQTATGFDEMHPEWLR